MSTTEFRINVDPVARLEKRIERGDYVDGEQLADVLRKGDTPPFQKIFFGYLCRFLESKIKRGRGRPKAPNSRERHRGNTCHRHLEHVTKRIRSGDFVSGPELAEVLRREAAGQIPGVLLEYLCRFLTGNIKKPRGRPPLPPNFKRQRDMIIHGLYRYYAEYLIKRKARGGKAAGWTRLSYPPAEIAARIVARYHYHGECSWRSVQTLSSAYRKRRQLF